MNVTESTTVGEIAAANPAAVKVFQKYGIDFCCGGKRPLGEVCRERGIGEDEVLSEIERASAPRQGESRDWSRADLAELMNYIVSTHHEFMKMELPRLAQMAAKVREAHGAAHPEVIEIERVFLGLKEEIDGHLMKEEMVLFPLIERMEAASKAGAGLPPAHCGSVNNPIRVMEHEHENAGRALAEMRQLSNGYAVPADACNTFRAYYHGLQEVEADLHQHIHLENNILHPRASRLEAGF
jgi:regulator of cell morphogenesis and NO signaling